MTTLTNPALSLRQIRIAELKPLSAGLYEFENETHIAHIKIDGFRSEIVSQHVKQSASHHNLPLGAVVNP